MKISFEDFCSFTGCKEKNFSVALHEAGLLVTPKFPSGWGETQATRWIKINGSQFRAVRVGKSPTLYEGGIPVATENTKWRIEMED